MQCDEKILQEYGELHRLIRVGAYTEHPETEEEDDGIERRVDWLHEQAAQEGLQLVRAENGAWRLEPMSQERKAAFKQAMASRHTELLPQDGWSDKLADRGY